MGTWGHRSFENDAAQDWLAGAYSEGLPSISSALEIVAEAQEDTYLDQDSCAAALVAAELVLGACGGGTDRLDEDALAWLLENQEEVAGCEVGLASRAVTRVLNSSELSDLWGENGPDTEWHSDVRELLRRLSKLEPVSR